MQLVFLEKRNPCDLLIESPSNYGDQSQSYVSRSISLAFKSSRRHTDSSSSVSNQLKFASIRLSSRLQSQHDRFLLCGCL